MSFAGRAFYMTYKLAKTLTKERFAELCAQMTRREIAEHLDISIWGVIHYEDTYGMKPKPGKRGRRPTREPGEPRREPVARQSKTTPYRLSWLVQGGLWLDQRHTQAGA